MPESDRFPLTAAQLVANWAETLFYGIYLATCAFAARTLLLTGSGRDERWLRLNEIQWLMVFFAVAFFVDLTFDISIGIYHNYAAFIIASSREGPLEHFLNLADWVNVARSVTQCFATVLGDFILIYRCWVVYGKRWLIILPSIILYLATLAVSIRFIQVEVAPVTSKDKALNDSQATDWLLTVFALATGQSVLSTGLLIYRIWKVDRDISSRSASNSSTGKQQPRYLRKIIIIIAESGAFYTVTILISALLCAAKSEGLYPTADIALQATGIAFNAILVRASKVRERQFKAYNYELPTIRVHTQPQKVNVRTTTFAYVDHDDDVNATRVNSNSKRSTNDDNNSRDSIVLSSKFDP